MGKNAQGTAVVDWPAQEMSPTAKPKNEIVDPIDKGYTQATRIHCPRCGTKMLSSHRGLTEMGLLCPGCNLLAIWYGRVKVDMLQWNIGELEP